MSIGGRLKQWRESKKLKQDEASSLLGTPFSTLQKYEMDISKPGADAIIRFIDAGINATWLLKGIGPMLVTDLGVLSVVQSAPVIEEEAEQEYVCPVDHDRLLQAITEVNEMVKLHHGNNRLPDKQMATAIAMAYEEIEEEERQASQAAKARSQSILNRLAKQK
jgi:transcriptional regulator with XRE-family HTH domain